MIEIVRVRSSVLAGGLLAGGLLALAACESAPILDPAADPSGGARPAAAAGLVLAEVCATADFESFAHGDAVTAVSLPAIDLGFDVQVFPSGGALPAARAWDTDTPAPPGDPFLAWSGDAAACPECAGRGNVLVVEDGAGFASGGASDFGGTFFLDGFTRTDAWIASVTAVGAGESPGSHRLLVDADELAASVPEAGTVQALTPAAPVPVTAFVELSIAAAARGAFDDLVFCRMMEVPGDGGDGEPGDGGDGEPGDGDGDAEPRGGEGCGPGFWKGPRREAAWSAAGFAPADPAGTALGALPDVLQRPEATRDPAALTLLDALRLRGGGVNALLRHATAALLNAASGDVSFDLAPDEVRELVAAALAGGDVEDLARHLDDLNGQVCPLD
ncbi:MAG: hypothetical protein RRA92_06405 [Gemmatimonadota bacterium]|nr:hypothetical protein [Gemmatimonadota bacterium]